MNQYETIILLGMLSVAILLLYKTYQKPVNRTTYITNIYLYDGIALFVVSLLGRYVQTLQITDQTNIVKFIILYFILGFGGIFLMVQDGFFKSHIGWALLLIGVSLIIGSSYRYATNIGQATAVTGVIVGILTLITFNSSDKQLEKMAGWNRRLVLILCGAIIVQLLMLVFGYNETMAEVVKYGVLVLFVFFVLSDTSRIIKKANSIKTKDHTKINYPMESSSLMLDYLNVYANLLSFRRRS